MHVDRVAVRCPQRHIAEAAAARFTRLELEQLPDRGLHTVGVVVGVTRWTAMGVHAVLGYWLLALEIVEEREALHLLEDHTPGIPRVAVCQLLLIERERPGHDEVR